MAKTRAERMQDKREDRVKRYHEQLASGQLIVRQMTLRERAYWNERSTEAERLATPEERQRRDAARENRRRRLERSSASRK
jgi:hypothetical protein